MRSQGCIALEDSFNKVGAHPTVVVGEGGLGNRPVGRAGLMGALTPRRRGESVKTQPLELTVSRSPGASRAMFALSPLAHIPTGSRKKELGGGGDRHQPRSCASPLIAKTGQEGWAIRPSSPPRPGASTTSLFKGPSFQRFQRPTASLRDGWRGAQSCSKISFPAEIPLRKEPAVEGGRAHQSRELLRRAKTA